MPSEKGSGSRRSRSRSRGRYDRDKDRDRDFDKRRNPRSISRSPNRFSDERYHRRRKYPSRSRSRSRGRYDNKYHYNSSSRHYKDYNKSRSSSRSRSCSKSSYKNHKSRNISPDRHKTHRSTPERYNHRDHKFATDSNKSVSHNHHSAIVNKKNPFASKNDDNPTKYSKEEKKTKSSNPPTSNTTAIVSNYKNLRQNVEDLDLPLPKDNNEGDDDDYRKSASKDNYEKKSSFNSFKKEKPQKYYQFDENEEIDKEKIHKEIEEKLRQALAKEGKVYPPPKQEASHPVFANDGSFLEIFKKMQQQQVTPALSTATTTPANLPVVPTLPVPLPVISTATPSTVPYLASSALGTAVPLPPPPPIVGRRRGGKILKTGLVAKQKPQSETGSDPKDFWSLYLAEVNKYKNTACESEGGTRPLVK